MKFTDEDIEVICIGAIKQYLNKPFTNEEIKEKYNAALLVMIEESKDIINKNATGISSMSQGSQSITYNTTVQAFKVSESVKALLPKPSLKLY